MPDTCYWIAHVHPEDVARFEEIIGFGPNKDGLFEDCEANYGHADRMHLAAGAGLRFHGRHDACASCYGAFKFCSWEGALHQLEAGCDGGYVVEFDGEEPITGSLAEVAGFIKTLTRCIDELCAASIGEDGGADDVHD